MDALCLADRSSMESKVDQAGTVAVFPSDIEFLAFRSVVDTVVREDTVAVFPSEVDFLAFRSEVASFHLEVAAFLRSVEASFRPEVVAFLHPEEESFHRTAVEVVDYPSAVVEVVAEYCRLVRWTSQK